MAQKLDISGLFNLLQKRGFAHKFPRDLFVHSSLREALVENPKIHDVIYTACELKVFEDEEILPGTFLEVKAVLHDQTGDEINSTVFITIKNSDDKILEQKEINTDELFDYSIKAIKPL